MNIFKILHLAAGMVFRKRGMILGLWVFTTAFSLVLAIPPFVLLNREFGHSLTESSVGMADFLWMADIHHRFRDLLPLIPLWLAAPVLLFMIFWIFLSGGVIGTLAGKGKTSFGTFFADSGKYFPRFLVVSLLSLPVLVVVFGGLFRLVQIPLNRWADRAPDETSLLAASVLKLLAFGLLVSVVLMFFHYVKVRIVLAGERSPLRAVEDTSLFLGRYFVKAWALFLIPGILVSSITGLFLAILGIFPAGGTGALLGGLVLSQFTIAARIAFQAFVYAADIQFMRSVCNP